MCSHKATRPATRLGAGAVRVAGVGGRGSAKGGRGGEHRGGGGLPLLPNQKGLCWRPPWEALDNKALTSGKGDARNRQTASHAVNARLFEGCGSGWGQGTEHSCNVQRAFIP